MQSPWENDYRSRQLDYDDMKSERSTSAPPPETPLGFMRGDGGGGVGGNGYLGMSLDDRSPIGQAHLNNIFDNRGRSNNVEIDSLFLDAQNKRGRAPPSTSYDNLPPGFSSDFLTDNGRPNGTSRSYGVRNGGGSNNGGGSGGADSRYDLAFDRATIGETLIRSQSAAPSLDGRLSLGPPPGLVSSQTPLASNRSNNGGIESVVDRSSVLQSGQRRPASTGVIGQSQNSSSSVLSALGLSSGGSGNGGGVVRPGAKTLMDLIQEDFPESSMQNDNYDPYVRENDNMYMDRPRTTSPLSQHTRDHYAYSQRDNEQYHGRDNLSAGVERVHVPPSPNGYNGATHTQERHQRPTPQYVTVDQRGRPQGEPRVQGSIYAPVPAHPSQGAPVATSHPQQGQFDQQTTYNAPQQVHTQVLQPGHTVYVNAPSPQYGYATVQYHPHSQQHHIVHQTIPGGIHPTEGQQYISVVPIQGGGAPMGGQTYAYWQPDGQMTNGVTPTVTIVNAHGPGGVPLAVARVGNSGMEQQHQHQPNTAHNRGAKEKGGKVRRGGTGNARRGATDTKQHSQSVGSYLLEEFRATKNRDWTIFDIKGHVVEFCQDQNGSRFIQQRLEIGDDGEKEVVMTEVLPAVRRLRNDVFGNYVVQKLLDFGTSKMKEDLRDTLTGEMLPLSLQMYGCRVVQKALETLDEDDLPRLLTEFHHNVLSCIHDQNGNHVIQKCIEVMSNKAKHAREMGERAKGDFFGEQIDFIVDDVLGNVASLSCHPYGCRVLQRILEHCVEPRKSRALDEISLCHKTLLDDQYGNYVIQHVLQFGRHSDRESVLGIVVENGLLSLSRQKFASNVVEKLLKYGTAQQRKAVVREMLKVVDERTGQIVPPETGGTSVVLLMVRDAYANYVVQTTLDVIPECEEKRLLLEELNSHSTELRNYTFAKHIVTKLSS